MLESTISLNYKQYQDNKLVGDLAGLHLLGSLGLLHLGPGVPVPLKAGDIDHISQRGGGLLPVDIACAVLVNHVLEDGPEPLVAAGRVSLLSEPTDLVVKPGAAHVAGVAKVGVVVAGAGALVTADLLVNPARGLAHISVHSGHTILSAPDAPGHDAGLDIGVGVILAGADQGGASVTLARVLAGHAPAQRKESWSLYFWPSLVVLSLS